VGLYTPAFGIEEVFATTYIGSFWNIIPFILYSTKGTLQMISG
jgi:hypothetical protein